MSGNNKKFIWLAKKQDNMTHKEEKNQSIKTQAELTHMLD